MLEMTDPGPCKDGIIGGSGPKGIKQSQGLEVRVETRAIGGATRVTKKEPKKRQAYFKTSTNKITCEQCNMSYVPHLKLDSQLHDKFHQRALNGREWSSNWGKKLYDLRVQVKGVEHLASMVEVDISNRSEVRATKELLDLVNTELQAPNDCGNWLKGREFGKVFLCILNKRAIGLICLESVSEGEWLILETGNIVPNRKIPLVVGISRIYVARNYRRCHIGLHLLNCMKQNYLYGVELKKTDIGWSQPSEFGSKLALRFNSMKHKSGHNLLPTYIEKDVKS